MKVFRISGRAGKGEMQELLPENALLLDAGKINSEEELELAYRLARDAFDKRRNIAKQFRYEFLLWISGKKDIDSALKEFGPSKNGEMLLVVFGDEHDKILKELKASTKPLKLKKTAEPLDIERISLSRIRN